MDQSSNLPTNLTVTEWPHSPEFQDFANFLGLFPEKGATGVFWGYDDRTNKKIEDIYIYAKKHSNSPEHVDVKVATRELQHRLGVTEKGKTLVDHLWQYTKVASDREVLSKQLGLLDETPSEKPQIVEAPVPEPTQEVKKPNHTKERLTKQFSQKEEELKQQIANEKLKAERRVQTKQEEMSNQLAEERAKLEKKYQLKEQTAEQAIQAAIEAAKVQIARNYERKLANSQRQTNSLLEQERTRLNQEHQLKLKQVMTNFSSMIGGTNESEA